MPKEPGGQDEQNWWMSRGGEVYGPYDYQTVLFCRQDGRIVDDDYVKCGEEPWRRASEALPEARAAAAATRTSPPRPSRPSSQKWIIIGVVAGAAFMLLAALAVFAAILLPVFGRAREKAQETASLSNVKQLGMAVLMYAADHEEILPEANSWKEAIAEYVGDNKAIFTCPVTGQGYIFNKVLSGVDLKDIDNPQQTPMLWEAPLDAGQPVGPHMGRFVVCYADGHATMVDKLPTAD